MVRRTLRLIVTVLLSVIVVAGLAWSALALWFDGPDSRLLAGTLAVGLLAASLGLVALVRPLRRGLVAAVLPVVAVALWWSSIPPSNDRDWSPDVARLARAAFNGRSVTIQNVRNFKYRSESDYDQRWETRSYNLDRIRGVDLFLSFWGPTQIAHTIVSWEFDDGQHLAISIETRKEQGEAYSAIRGFFRQYELYYVVADERDLVGLRASYRAEQVYLYPIRLPASQAQALLVEYLDDVNRLADHPRWYNALTQNCTTTIRSHAQNAGGGGRLDWRLLANGHLDQLLYERGQIDTDLPLADLRARSNITARAKAATDSADFSALIRQGLPETPSIPLSLFDKPSLGSPSISVESGGSLVPPSTKSESGFSEIVSRVVAEEFRATSPRELRVGPQHTCRIWKARFLRDWHGGRVPDSLTGGQTAQRRALAHPNCGEILLGREPIHQFAAQSLAPESLQAAARSV